eukprot:156710_1
MADTSALSSENLAKIMKEEGPIVQGVLLKHNGDIEEMALDMTPRKNLVAKILGGTVSFVGQFPTLEVVVMKLREPGADVATNMHKLQPPLHKATVKGDMLLVRMNESAIPVDFTKAEYDAFMKEDHSATADAMVDEVPRDDGEPEESPTGENEQGQQLIEQICAAYRLEHDRDPSVEEIKTVLRSLQDPALAMADEDDDEEDDEDFELEEVTDEDEEDDDEDDDDIDIDTDEEDEAGAPAAVSSSSSSAPNATSSSSSSAQKN